MPEWAIAEVVGFLPNASNATLLAVVESGDFVVYKPAAGERPLWDFPTGTLPNREVLSFEISEAMGLGIVPETRLVEGPHGPGSAQRFIDEDSDFDPRPLFTPELSDTLWPFALLDIVCNNADRKIGHILKETGSDRMWAIDNALTFNEEPKLRTVLWGFAGLPIPDGLTDAVQLLEDQLGTLVARAGDLLSESEAQALRERCRDLIDRPVHPHPPTDRPAVPWPIW